MGALWNGSIIPRDPDAQQRIEDKAEKCECPEAPFDCSFWECRSDCRACKRRRTA